MLSQTSSLLEKKFNGLDHLRAFAIFFVFISHLPLTGLGTWLAAFVTLGWSGVDLFFVLSGFLIATHLFNTTGTKKWLGQFYVKRVFRIFPAYFTVVALYFLVPFFREGKALPPLWKLVTFTQNIAVNPAAGAFLHAWSLCAEEQFYLLFPFVLLLLHRLRILKYGWAVLLFITIVFFLLRCFIWHHYVVPVQFDDNNLKDLHWLQYIYMPVYTRLDGFIAGISIAALYKYRPVFMAKFLTLGNYILISGIVILMIAFGLSLNRTSFTATIWGLPVLALGYACLLCAALSPHCILYKIKSPLTSFIAMLSYSIYLIHRSIIYICQTWLHKNGVTNQFWVVVISSISVLLAAWVLYTIIEKPGFKVRNRLLKKYFSQGHEL